jgi:hypothetical protein
MIIDGYALLIVISIGVLVGFALIDLGARGRRSK